MRRRIGGVELKGCDVVGGEWGGIGQAMQQTFRCSLFFTRSASWSSSHSHFVTRLNEEEVKEGMMIQFGNGPTDNVYTKLSSQQIEEEGFHFRRKYFKLHYRISCGLCVLLLIIIILDSLRGGSALYI